MELRRWGTAIVWCLNFIIPWKQQNSVNKQNLEEDLIVLGELNGDGEEYK